MKLSPENLETLRLEIAHELNRPVTLLPAEDGRNPTFTVPIDGPPPKVYMGESILIESILTRLIAVRGSTRFAKMIADEIRDDVRENPTLMPDAVAEWLDKINHVLTPKG